MPFHEALKKIDPALYPDVEKAGGLGIAISKALADMGSSLVAERASDDQFIVYARVEKGSRFSQIYIAGGQRLFLFDFWSEGVFFGNASCDNILDVVSAIHTWIVDIATIEKMSSLFTFFSPTENGKAYEAGVYVEHQWQGLLASWQEREKTFREPDLTPTLLIAAAMKRPELRQLFPFTSLTRLRFSRTTGFPFTQDCPIVEPQGAGIYRVYMQGSLELLGEGTIEEALDIVVKYLPSNCGPAVSGTADDFVP